MLRIPAALACAVALFATPAVAADQLAGAWSTAHSESRGARAGESGHGLSDGDAFMQGSEEVWTFTIEEAKGQGFHATWCSENVCEDAVGVVRASGDIVAADEDGYFFGEMLADGNMELCYLEAGTAFRVADCHTLAKE